MNRKGILLLLFIVVVQSLYSSSFTQVHNYRWRNDDGNEATANWKANINTPVEIEENEKVRLRIEIKRTYNTAPSNVDLSNVRLQYNRNSIGWIDVTSSTTDVRLTLTDNFTDGDVTTEHLDGGYSFASGKCFESSNNHSQILNYNNDTEWEYMLEFIEPGNYQFKMSNINGNYVTPLITVNAYTPPVNTSDPTITPPDPIRVGSKISGDKGIWE